jgi:hypothetical protein
VPSHFETEEVAPLAIFQAQVASLYDLPLPCVSEYILFALPPFNNDAEHLFKFTSPYTYILMVPVGSFLKSKTKLLVDPVD